MLYRHRCVSTVGLAAIQMMVAMFFASSNASSQTADQNYSDVIGNYLSEGMMKAALNSVGALNVLSSDGSSITCNAVVISPKHVMTTSYCALPEMIEAFFRADPSGTGQVRLRTPALERSENLGYAIFEAAGVEQAELPPPVKLLTRIPLRGEAAYIVQFVANNTKSKAVHSCRVTDVEISFTNYNNLFSHNCDTLDGSGGAILFSMKDNAVLGINALSSLERNISYAYPIYSIALKSAVVNAIASSRAPIVEFTTRNHNLIELDQELTRILLTLYNSGRMPVRKLAVDAKSTIDNILRDIKLVYGPQLTVQLDSLACDLNRHVCDRSRVPAIVTNPVSLTEHVSGSLPSRGNWSEIRNTELIVPDIRTVENRDWVEYEKVGGTDIRYIVEHQLGGCTKLDDNCKSTINFYNQNLRTADGKPKDIFDPNFDGTLRLPVLTVSFAVELSTASESPPTSSAPITEVRPNGSLVLQPSIGPKGETYKVQQSGNASNDLKKAGESEPKIEVNSVLNTLQQNLVRGLRIGRFAADVLPNDFKMRRTTLLKLIKFPFDSLPYPANLKGAVPVAVFENGVDKDHCALNSGRITVVDSGLDTIAKKGNCNEWQEGDKDTDHGTHVVGIIGALFPSTGTPTAWGLNPYAHIYAQELSFSDLSTNTNVKQIVSNFTKLIEENYVRVANLSFGYLMASQNPDFQWVDEFETAISALPTLFVTAAGNGGIDKSTICDVRPACFELPNVISVAALNEDASDLLADSKRIYSNHGRRIHVAAPGEKIFSTITNGRFGTLSGTSQSAPQVTALASLLFSKYPDMRTSEIKNRIIYCSEITPTLEGKLFGGRVDADCTLDGDNPRVQLSSAPSVQHGKFQPGSELKFEDKEGGEYVISISNIRSIQYNFIKKRYTVFYNAERNRKDTILLKAANLILRNNDEILTFDFDDGPAAGTTGKIKAGDITRYVSAR